MMKSLYLIALFAPLLLLGQDVTVTRVGVADFGPGRNDGHNGEPPINDLNPDPTIFTEAWSWSPGTPSWAGTGGTFTLTAINGTDDDILHAHFSGHEYDPSIPATVYNSLQIAPRRPATFSAVWSFNDPFTLSEEGFIANFTLGSAVDVESLVVRLYNGAEQINLNAVPIFDYGIGGVPGPINLSLLGSHPHALTLQPHVNDSLALDIIGPGYHVVPTSQAPYLPEDYPTTHYVIDDGGPAGVSLMLTNLNNLFPSGDPVTITHTTYEFSYLLGEDSVNNNSLMFSADIMQISPVPEPSGIMLAMAGGGLMLLRRRRLKKGRLASGVFEQ